MKEEKGTNHESNNKKNKIPENKLNKKSTKFKWRKILQMNSSFINLSPTKSMKFLCLELDTII